MAVGRLEFENTSDKLQRSGNYCRDGYKKEETQKQFIKQLNGPLISVIIPVYNVENIYIIVSIPY